MYDPIFHDQTGKFSSLYLSHRSCLSCGNCTLSTLPEVVSRRRSTCGIRDGVQPPQATTTKSAWCLSRPEVTIAVIRLPVVMKDCRALSGPKCGMTCPDWRTRCNAQAQAREARTKPAVVSRIPSVGSPRSSRPKGWSLEKGIPARTASSIRLWSEIRYCVCFRSEGKFCCVSCSSDSSPWGRSLSGESHSYARGGCWDPDWWASLPWR